MIRHDSASFAALGRALASARDEGILSDAQFAPLARALAASIATGVMPLDAYAGIHHALADILEAAFAAPVSHPSSDTEESHGESLGAHLEIIGEVWDRVEAPDAGLRDVASFFGQAFDLSSAAFGNSDLFDAPLAIDPSELPTLLRRAGFTVLAQAGTLPEGFAARGIMTGLEEARKGIRFELGWGDRRFALWVV